ncbi:MAG: hypothetical protein NXH82_11740 [Rhodobacteraceae bacterium]|nr:hypothetical protein [Paracoccaceae bacterium]
MQDDVLARVYASAPRRWLGVGMLTTVGTLVIYVALATPPELGWQLFLLATGAVSLWLADKMRRATMGAIELTETELRDETGQTIVAIADIESIDRGIFAFKPSNGFLIKTRAPGPRRWQPGLWWRTGRRLGVGGVTAAAQTKFMSEMISAILTQRDAGR